MGKHARRLPLYFVLSAFSISCVVYGREILQGRAPHATSAAKKETLPEKEFSRPPKKPHSVTDTFFSFDQLEHHYRIPGEFTHRLIGDQYGFETLSFFLTETHPGGGPGLHVHDSEEAHVLLEGSARYRIGEKTIEVQGPYVAKVPAGVPHTFVNIGDRKFNLTAVFASKHPTTKRLGPNPLIPATGAKSPAAGR